MVLHIPLLMFRLKPWLEMHILTPLFSGTFFGFLDILYEKNDKVTFNVLAINTLQKLLFISFIHGHSYLIWFHVSKLIAVMNVNAAKKKYWIKNPETTIY